MAQEEVYEAIVDPVQWTENLFQKMQIALHSLVQKYEIQEIDLKSSLEVIGQLWELVEETQNSCDTYQEQLKELEEKWKDEKTVRRLVEKRKADIENRFDEERYTWQTEKQELQMERAALEIKNRHLGQRNKELLSDLTKQRERFEENQKLRDNLMDQYKKEYEIAKTSSLRRSKSKKKTPAVLDYSPSTSLSPTNTSSSRSKDSGIEGAQSLSPPVDEQSSTMTTPPRHKRYLPAKNVISLRTEMRHPRGNSDNIPEVMTQEDSESDDEDTEAFMSFSLQQELLNVSPDILAPAAAELELLKKEQDQIKKENALLQSRLEQVREEKEDLESENAQFSVEVNHYKTALLELQEQLALLRQERDEILETYLDQPFDVYCVTKKELHEVLKKLHETQLEVQKQNEEKQTLKMQLHSQKRQKKSSWKRFAERFQNIFHRQNHKEKTGRESPEPIVETITSFQMPPEALFSPKKKEEIMGTDNFTPEKGWFVPRDGLPTPASLPSLYCQITLKEYHVTERVNCIALGQVRHKVNISPLKKQSSLLPLAARTPCGRLCAEVWVASSEGPASFIEVIDVLAKKVIDRFLVKGSRVLSMVSVPGKLSTKLEEFVTSPKVFLKPSPSKDSDLFHNYHPNWFSSSNGNSPHLKEQHYCNGKQGLVTQETNTVNPAQNFGDTEREELYQNEPVKEEQERCGSPVDLFRSDEDSSGGSTPLLKRLNNMKTSDNLKFNRNFSLPLSSHLSSDSPTNKAPLTHESMLEMYSDEETGANNWRNSTPLKDNQTSPLSSCSGHEEEVEAYMWVISDHENIHLYSAHGHYNKIVRTIKLPVKPTCLQLVEGKVCIGLVDSRMVIYHMETIVSGPTWDLDNPSYIDLPLMHPDKPQPVTCVALVGKRLWVIAGAFISLIDADTLAREGMRFLDSINIIPNKLMPLDDVVLATTVKGPQLYVLDSNRAEVIRKIDISPTSLLIDNLISFYSLDITLFTKDANNVYIGTSLGKIFSIPLSFFHEDDTTADSDCYPPLEHKLFGRSAVSLHAHREGAIQGLLHIPLPEGISAPLSTSTLNLTKGSSSLSNASSLPNLLESPPLNRSTVSHPVYHSLLVTAGKGHVDYLGEQDIFQESTALRERNDAFQVMVWGFECL